MIFSIDEVLLIYITSRDGYENVKTKHFDSPILTFLLEIQSITIHLFLNFLYFIHL